MDKHSIYIISKKILFIVIYISIFQIHVSCQNPKKVSINETIINKNKTEEIDTSSKEVSFLFMGDFMQHGPQIRAAKDSNGNYNYDHYFEYTSSLINGVDFAIANLEVTLAGEPYAGYPKFSAPDEYAVAIKKAGFDILTTANNHSNDRGSEGSIRTIEVLDSLKIKHLGTYKDSSERIKDYPLILEKNGIKIALLNYTFSTNGIPTKSPNIVNMIDTISMLKDILDAKKHNVDKIIVITHWGGEYKSFPDRYQRKNGEWLLSNGADIVVGGHPHWVQPIEYRKDSLNEKVIAWSLGNIISNQTKEHTDGGSSLQFTVYRDDSGKVRIKDIGYHLHWVWIHKIEEQKRYQIIPISKYETSKIKMSTESWIMMSRFIENERSLYTKHNINVPEFKYDLVNDLYYLPQK